MQLDNIEMVHRADAEDALGVIGNSAEQLLFKPIIYNFTGTKKFSNIVLSGMGGSCLAGLIIKNWLDHDYKLDIPFEVCRDYVVPNYVDNSSLVICISVSGNTEEIIASLNDAKSKNATIVIITSGGKLLDIAIQDNIPYIQLNKISQPRYGIFMHLRAITKLLAEFRIINNKPYDELASIHRPVHDFTAKLSPEISTAHNQAKQLALDSVGKTALIYSSRLFSPLSYKWKTSYNENAKNIIWWNEFPEFNHNEFIGWTSHPIDKPFFIANLRSNLDNPRINRRLDLTEQLLSGYRPAVHDIILVGNSYIEQVVCGAILGDFISIYLGLLNGVDPTPVKLVERFKKEL